MNQNNRLIFNDDFYRIGAVILSKKFALLEQQAIKRFIAAGHPIPLSRFKTYDEYRIWLKKIMSSDYKLLPADIVNGILTEFNFPDNEYNRKGISSKIFFDKQFGENFNPLEEPIMLTTRIKNEQKELWVRVYPWTKKEDFDGLWETIKNIQPLLPGYRGKEKFQITFNRDFSLYELYLKAKNSPKDTSKSIIENMVLFPEYEKLSKQYTSGYAEDYVRSVSAKFNALLSNINLL